MLTRTIIISYYVNLYYYLSVQVVLSHASHLFMEHQYEPDPEERGSSWASRYIDSRRTFGYVPRNIYYNVDKNENGDPVNLEKICPNGNCLQLERPENIIGEDSYS